MATSAAYIDLTEGSAPATPASGKVRLYVKTDGLPYTKDDAAVESALVGGGGGDVATDTIFDAKGDLPVGTGANTAAKLTVGSNLAWPIAASGEATGLLYQRPASGRVVLTGGDFALVLSTFTDLSGASITITTLARRCLVGVTAVGQATTASDGAHLDIDIDGSRQGQTVGLVGVRFHGASHRGNLSFTYMTDVLSAGSHTFKVQGMKSPGSGTVNIFASGSQTPFTFWVQELA